jgi:predicted RNA-binding protein (virulence factor B family)
MSEIKKVVLVSWDPDVVDFSKWPRLTKEKLVAILEGDRDKLWAPGYQADILFIQSAESAYDTVINALNKTTYDCIQIGAGVKTIDEHFLVFEKLVNAVHQGAPNAKNCFNTNPSDTAESVQRWI